MTAIKNEHNRAKTQWVFEPVSVVAGVFLSKTIYLFEGQTKANLMMREACNKFYNRH